MYHVVYMVYFLPPVVLRSSISWSQLFSVQNFLSQTRKSRFCHGIGIGSGNHVDFPKLAGARSITWMGGGRYPTQSTAFIPPAFSADIHASLALLSSLEHAARASAQSRPLPSSDRDTWYTGILNIHAPDAAKHLLKAQTGREGDFLRSVDVKRVILR